MQRLALLCATRAPSSSSYHSLCLITCVTPLHIKIVEISCKRLFLQPQLNTAPSAATVASKFDGDSVFTQNIAPKKNFLHYQLAVKKGIERETLRICEKEWKEYNGGNRTKRIQPVPYSARSIKKYELSEKAIQLLTRKCYLKSYRPSTITSSTVSTLLKKDKRSVLKSVH